MSDDRWRLFVAVPLGDELRASLAAAAEGWRRRPDLAGLRWTDPDGWHVTVAFIGEVDPAGIPALARALDGSVRGRAARRLGTGALGGFPSTRAARVAWYGVADPDRWLAALQADVCRGLGLAPPAADVQGHVTLARARGGPVDLRAWVADADPPRGMLAVAGIELLRSHLGRGPARYERLSFSPLEVTADD